MSLPNTSDGGYLVAQAGDAVKILEPGLLYGTFGDVVDQHTDDGYRICTVRSDGDAVMDIDARNLKVLR